MAADIADVKDSQREVCLFVEKEFAKLREWLDMRIPRHEDLVRLLSNACELQSSPGSLQAIASNRGEPILSGALAAARQSTPGIDQPVHALGSCREDLLVAVPQEDSLRSTAQSSRVQSDSDTSIEELALPGCVADGNVASMPTVRTNHSHACWEDHLAECQGKNINPEGSVPLNIPYSPQASKCVWDQEWQSQLMDVFDQLDVDGSGSIDSDELAGAFQEVGLPFNSAFDIFRSMDNSGNDFIDRMEWLRALERASNSSSEGIEELVAFVEKLVTRQRREGKIYATNQHARRLHFFIFRHDAGPRMSWDIMLTCLLFYVAMTVPYSFGFGTDQALEVINTVVDFIFCIDVMLNFRTSYIDSDDNTIMSGKLIAKRYLRSWFLLDFVSSVPWEMVTAGLMPDLTPARLLKIGKLAKVAKLLRISKMQKVFADSEFMERLEEKSTTKAHQRVLKLTQLVWLAFILGHWLACSGAAVDHTFLDVYLAGKTQEEPTPIQKYLAAMYWAMVTLSTVGYGDITPQTDSERAFAMFALVVGSAFYGYIIGSVTSIVSDIDINTRAFYARMDAIQAWLGRHHEVPKVLRRRVRRHFKSMLSNRSAMDDGAVVRDLSPELRAHTTYFIVHKHVRQNPMFSDISNSALAPLIDVLQKNYTNANEYIVNHGDPGIAMYVLVVGTARFDKGVRWRPEGCGIEDPRFLKLHEGASFGEEILFGLEETYRYTIKATSNCEVHSISEDGFRNRYVNMPELRQAMLASFIKSRTTQERIIKLQSKGTIEVLSSVSSVLADGR